MPDLVALDLPALIRAAGYPGTRIVPATSWLLSLLVLPDQDHVHQRHPVEKPSVSAPFTQAA